MSCRCFTGGVIKTEKWPYGKKTEMRQDPGTVYPTYRALTSKPTKVGDNSFYSPLAPTSFALAKPE